MAFSTLGQVLKIQEQLKAGEGYVQSSTAIRSWMSLARTAGAGISSVIRISARFFFLLHHLEAHADRHLETRCEKMYSAI